MSIQVTIPPDFARAYQRYAGFSPGETYRLYVRTGGPGTGGLFYAIEKDVEYPGDAVWEVEGMRFVIRPSDFWYFDGGEFSHNPLLGEFGFQFHNPALEDE